MSKSSFLLVVMTSLILTACGGTNSSSAKLKSANSELNLAATEAIDYTIIPAANYFQQQVQALVSNSESFCSANNITEENLIALQTQWQATNNAWFELLPYRFGPMIDSEVLPTYIFIDYHRQRGSDSTDTVRSNIDSLIATSSDNEFTARLAQIGANGLGLLALEVVLFEDAANQSKEATDIVSEFQSTARKCDVLTEFGHKLLNRADDIQQGWTSNYRATGKSYRDLIINHQLEVILDDESGESAIKTLMVSMQEFYDYLAKRDVTTNVAQISETTWLALGHSVSSTEALLAGTDQTTISLNAIMKNNRFEQTVSNIEANLKTLKLALEEKNTINTQSIAGTLDGNFKRDIPDALNINLGLNFSDGD